jgi:hypothetical protein
MRLTTSSGTDGNHGPIGIALGSTLITIGIQMRRIFYLFHIVYPL